MNRLRNRLILIFVLATTAPLAATVWITTALLDRSLRLASTRELDELSKSLETTGRALYQRTRESLVNDVEAGRLQPLRFARAERTNCGPPAAANGRCWPVSVQDFYDSGEAEHLLTAGPDGAELQYMVRRGDEVLVYSKPLGTGLKRVAAQYSQARALVEGWSARDLRRGFQLTLILLAAGVWLLALVALIYWAHRISSPIHELTGGLSQLAAGNLAARLRPRSRDEVGAAMAAFNHTAEQLQTSRDRLVYLTRLASWQTLARKMAHEVKNSLTPIRLTMEELTARHRGDRFLEQAAQIVVDEVATLERRVRAFSEFAAEPPVRPGAVDVTALLEERVSFLKAAHPEVIYQVHLAAGRPMALADEDLIKSVLTNLLENAAEAAGGGGVLLCRTRVDGGQVGIEVHDSGPGLSLHARESLFEPTISFKKGGMGLGLSIARRSALLSGGDILLIESELGGAAFRVVLPLSRDSAAVNVHASEACTHT